MFSILQLAQLCLIQLPLKAPTSKAYVCWKQANPRLQEAAQLYGGCLSSPSELNVPGRTVVLVVADMQDPDLSAAPPKMTDLHVTSVDHLLVSQLCIGSPYLGI